MLFEILKSIRNFFPDTNRQKSGQFTISGNVIAPFIELKPGQYFLIEGSGLNDGVHQATDGFADEIFSGTITPLCIPASFLNLVAEIEEYEAKDKTSAFVSESFGGYSYTKATNANGAAVSWREAFATRLNAWRKL